MAGIYIHIPFCRKACHYCNFHFSTSLHRKPALVKALLKEIGNMPIPEGITTERTIETIYFGGGTPSILDINDLQEILTLITSKFDVQPHAEITLEANPDDMHVHNLWGWKQMGINRLSVGVQSFFDEDLSWMNRTHNASEAIVCIDRARQFGFNDFSLDLIYGMPTLSDEQWQKNVEQAVELGVNHLSCYALTVEERTALFKMIQQEKVAPVQEDKQNRHFNLLTEWMNDAGFEHYEISNFAMPGHRSKHNSNYWSGKAYYGFGPSAHSFDGQFTRWWNVANNAVYIDSLENNTQIFDVEKLTELQRINEQIMTGLRTIEGVQVHWEAKRIGNYKTDTKSFETFSAGVVKYEKLNMLKKHENGILLTNQGKFFADGIAADLFV